MPLRFAMLAALLLLALTVARADEPARFAKLPQKVSSLGACTLDGFVYIYGGHTGTTHKYSSDTTIGKFYRAKLSGGEWAELPAGPAVQGLALVAHKGKIYRIGGMQPRNKPDEKSDNHSLTSCAAYDPATKKWQDIAVLPEGRSSHDAVVVGDKIYVFGGWTMHGGSKQPTWHKTGLVLDLATTGGKWQSIDQPFARRALAVEALGGKVYVLGGLSNEKGTKARVDVYDPANQKWSESVALPEKESSMGIGFAPAACVQDGRLFVSTNDGSIHRLSKEGKNWEFVGKQKYGRFVPRLLAGEKGALIALGGNLSAVDREKGDEREVEVIAPK